jgi:hypothetical protein
VARVEAGELVSFLTDVAVVTIGGEDKAVAFVNARLAENDPRPQQLAKADLETAGAGGHKATSVVVYAACFNYLDFGGFEDAVRAAPWRLPGCVVVYVDGEGFPGAFAFSPARAGDWKTTAGPAGALRRCPGQRPGGERCGRPRPRRDRVEGVACERERADDEQGGGDHEQDAAERPVAGGPCGRGTR